jgi:hypothetical protein
LSNSELKQSTSDLFLLRLWTDEAVEPPGAQHSARATAPSQRHGRLLHVYSGEGRNFDDWHGLVDLLEEMFSPLDQQSPSALQPASSESAGQE